MRFALLLALLLSCVRGALAIDPIRVAPDVFMFAGDRGEPTVANGGNTGNSGFIIAQHGVIVIDTGASHRHGIEMIRAISQVTDKPIRLVIITHAVQDFLFGNAAFEALGVPILAHDKSLSLMRSRCEHCLANLRQLLGEEAMRGTRLVLPDRLVSETQTIAVAGRRLRLLHFGWGATPGDLAIDDVQSGVLFTGGLVSAGRIPELRDGKLDGWLGALDALERVPARILVPAHGPACSPGAIDDMRRYLLALDLEARSDVESGRSLLEAVDAASQPAFRDWALYPNMHRKNLQQRYLELEVQELDAR